MPEEQIIIHKDTRFRMVIERAAGVKSGDGFKVEAQGDDLNELDTHIEALYIRAKELVRDSIPQAKQEDK